MPCYHPLEGFRGADGSLVFARHKGTGLAMRVPCGRCIGCRLERSRQWALRCMHEASLHDNNCFVTLTYDDGHLPEDHSVDVREWQLFAKRLRKKRGRFRFFHCGEYGSKRLRPHYHALLFGLDFPDKVPFENGKEYPEWISAELDAVWRNGRTLVGSITFESAAYVARYATKKVTGRRAGEHYERVNPLTGEVWSVSPEYATMSRRPGIGAGWIEKFHEDVYPWDECVARGHPSKPPRYYDEWLKSAAPNAAAAVLDARRRARSREDETPDRLSVREVCAEARLNLYARELE